MDQPALHDKIYAWVVLWNVRRRVGTSISSRYSKLALINTQTMMYGIQKWDGVREAAFLEGNVEIFEWVLLTGPSNRT